MNSVTVVSIPHSEEQTQLEAGSLPSRRRPGRPRSGIKKIVTTMSLEEGVYHRLMSFAEETGSFPSTVVSSALDEFLTRRSQLNAK